MSKQTHRSIITNHQGRKSYVSQTSGDPLPTLATMLSGGVEDFEKMKDILIAISPVPISFEEITGGANGYFSPATQSIVVKEGMSELQTIKTMIHEIAHATLGHGGKDGKWDRETKEVQAESVAYWVTQMVGLDTSDTEKPDTANSSLRLIVKKFYFIKLRKKHSDSLKQASRKSKISIRNIRNFLKRRRMPMLNTERLKRRTKNFRLQNTIWNGS